MTSLVQNDKLNTSQIARANLVAGTLISTRQLSFENGFDEWIEVLLESYICQTCVTPDFQTELRSFVEFVNQHLICDNSLDLKNSICEDIQMTLNAIEIYPEPTINTAHILKAA